MPKGFCLLMPSFKINKLFTGKQKRELTFTTHFILFSHVPMLLWRPHLHIIHNHRMGVRWEPIYLETDYPLVDLEALREYEMLYRDHVMLLWRDWTAFLPIFNISKMLFCEVFQLFGFKYMQIQSGCLPERVWCSCIFYFSPLPANHVYLSGNSLKHVFFPCKS